MIAIKCESQKKTYKYTALQNGVFVKLTAGGTYSYHLVNFEISRPETPDVVLFPCTDCQNFSILRDTWIDLNSENRFGNGTATNHFSKLIHRVIILRVSVSTTALVIHVKKYSAMMASHSHTALELTPETSCVWRPICNSTQRLTCLHVGNRQHQHDNF
jgi:hypothetical protein